MGCPEPLPVLLPLVGCPHIPRRAVLGAADARGLHDEKDDAKLIAPCGRPRNSVSVAQARVMSSLEVRRVTEEVRRVTEEAEALRIKLIVRSPPQVPTALWFCVCSYLNVSCWAVGVLGWLFCCQPVQ